MKKLSLLLVLLAIISCEKESENFATISGKIENTSQKTITIRNNNYSKEIAIGTDGTFKDTLHLKSEKLIETYEENFYGIIIGNASAYTYLKNGFDIILNADATNLNNKITYTGKGSENSNYILEKIEISKRLLNPNDYFVLEQADFDKKLNNLQEALNAILDKYPALDPDFASAEKESNTAIYSELKNNYAAQHTILKSTATGSPSPKFVNYENAKGGTTSLDDLKGKYVYIDVWATWCGPCKIEIPHLKRIEKKFHNKNIEFVSISIDQPTLHQQWLDMIEEKEMGGIQLFAGEDKSFSKAYQISGIPRFILIDPQGNIVSANAPRPSNPNLENLLNELGL